MSKLFQERYLNNQYISIVYGYTALDPVFKVKAHGVKVLKGELEGEVKEQVITVFNRMWLDWNY